MAWYRNGQIRERAVYENGRLKGRFLCYDESGQPMRIKDQESIESSCEEDDNAEDKEKMVDDLLSSLGNFEREKD
jgi:antitoxin component YwqK of YwqJK toxin-antitoxin module